MKVQAGLLTKEGFVAGVLLRFENGLELRTHKNMIWEGKRRSDEARQQVNDLLDDLEKLGYEVERSALSS